MRPTSSALLGQEWLAADGTSAALALPDAAMLEGVEQAWAAGREAARAHWNWCRIAATTNECFALLTRERQVISLWAAETRLRSIAGHRCYRMEFLEVGPAHRGRGTWGVLTMIAAAARAHELGATGLVFGALPARARWHARLGARPVSKYAWKAPPGTVRLSIVGTAFDALIEVARGEKAR